MATVVTNSGLANQTTQLSSQTLYLAVGTGAGTASATDTAMFTEDTTTGRTACTAARTTSAVTNDSITYTATVNFPSLNETITNVGLWTASTGGTLVYHRDLGSSPQAVGPTAGVSSITFAETITQ